MKGYAKYFAVPLGALLLLALRLLAGAARGPLPPVLVEAASPPGAPAAGDPSEGRLARLLEASTVASGVARPARPDEAPRARIRFLDGAADAGPPRAAEGGFLVLGYRSLLAEAPATDGRAGDSAGAAAGPRPVWEALYLPRLEDAPTDAPAALARWEAQEGRRWEFRGAGILLERLADSRVLVLRRGAELAKDFLVVRPGAGLDAPSSLFAGRFLVCGPGRGPSPEPLLSARFSFLPAGEALAAAEGLPGAFPLAWRESGSRVWRLAFDPLGGDAPRRVFAASLLPGLAARTALDEPLDGYARFRRLWTPLWRRLLEEALDES